MGWVVFLFGCLVTIPVGWLLFSRTRGDRFLSAVGLVLLPPTIWSAGLGLSIGPCDTPKCVTDTQQNLLMFAVAALIVLIGSLVAVGLLRAVPGALLMILACVLDMVGVWKVDKVTTIMFALLGISVGLYFALSLLPRRADPEFV
jgi:uncharacterized membrane protein